MGNNTFTGNYTDGAALTKAMLDTAYQSLQLDVSNTSLMTIGSADGQVLTSTGSGTAAAFETIPDPQGLFSLRNYGLKATVASGVMTITLTNKAGTAPSSNDPVNFNYSSNGTTSATYSTVNVTGATTFTLNASASLGITATITNRVFVYGYFSTSAAAIKLAISLRNDFDTGSPVSMTTVSASAESPEVLYASATLTALPRLLGYVDAAHDSGLLWQTPTKVNIVNGQLDNFENGRRTTPAATTTKLGQVAISASSGTFTSTATSYADVTNLSVTITTTGRPVQLQLISATGSSGSIAGSNGVIGAFGNFVGPKMTLVSYVRGSTRIAASAVYSDPNAINSNDIRVPVSFPFLDIVAAGTYTYKVQVVTVGVGTALVGSVSLLAYEI